MRLQDEERRRIARNLHDSFGQYLTSIKMSLESLRRSDAPNKDEVLSSALESVERSIVETRTLSCLLHPPLLDEVGFASAARWFTDEFAKRSGIKVELDLPGGKDRLPELVEITLFRILQESLTNVHRHSGSSAVEVRLQISEHQAVFSVRDFGPECPPGQCKDLRWMEVNSVSACVGCGSGSTTWMGILKFSPVADGTAITVSIPLETDTSDARTSARKELAS